MTNSKLQFDFGGILNKIYVHGVHMVESYIVSHLQRTPYTDLVTNMLAGGVSGGGIKGSNTREIIFDENGNVVCGRKYSERGGEKPLEHIDDIVFNRTGAIVGYSDRVSEKTGKRPAKIERDEIFEQYGGLRTMTGGIFPGLRSDLEIFDLKDRSGLYGLSERMSLEHYFGKSKLLGIDPFGRKLYKAEIPVTENPFRLLDPREYDLELIFKHLKQSTVYSMLNLFFDPAKIALSKSGFAPDPAIEIQTEAAYALSKDNALGTLALASYPLIFAFNALEAALGYPNKPINKKSQSIFTMPSTDTIKLADYRDRALPSETKLYTFAEAA